MRVVTLTSPDINNGLGCRVTCWISGCQHYCDSCHNKWLQDYNIGKPINEVRENIYDKLSLPYISGITFSGGDPLYQTDESLNELLELIKDIKSEFPEKDIWLFTGFTLEELDKKNNKIINEILKLIDYIVDGKFIKELKDVSLPFRGSSNQKIWRRENGLFMNVDDEFFKN